jgi:2,3-bisphosphoglycerate-independent phosphoglycerate mutase
MAGPVMLIIRDGWGINPGGGEKRNENGDATLLASTTFHDKLYADYPRSKLSARGLTSVCPTGKWATQRSAILISERAELFIKT